MTLPTCSLSVDSNGLITATYSDDAEGSGIDYYGWDSSYAGVKENTKTITDMGEYTFYVKDMTGNESSCSIEVEPVVTNTEYSCPHKGTAPDDCYNTYSATLYSGTCTCYYNNNNYTVIKSNKDVCYNYCLNTYGTDAYYFGDEKYKCGETIGSSSICRYSEEATASTSSVCKEGFSDENKVNDSYCWKVVE